MKELLDKLSSYNIFNYLLPGTVFAAIAERISEHRFSQTNIVVELFVYYFIGLVISRVDSLIIEPAMKMTRFVQFASYEDFVHACKRDSKIEMLSEQNNMYRTLCALFLALGGLGLYDVVVKRWGVPGRTIVLVGLFGLFAFACRKQTDYVRKRVEIGKQEQR